MQESFVLILSLQYSPLPPRLVPSIPIVSLVLGLSLHSLQYAGRILTRNSNTSIFSYWQTGVTMEYIGSIRITQRFTLSKLNQVLHISLKHWVTIRILFSISKPYHILSYPIVFFD